MKMAWWILVLCALLAVTGVAVVACGGDDDDDDDDDTGSDDDDDDDDDMGDDDDLSDDDMGDDDTGDDDAGDDDTAYVGCDPVGDETLTICNPVYPEAVDYSQAVNGWPMSVTVDFEGEIKENSQIWFDCRPTEGWPNWYGLGSMAGDTIGIIPYSFVLAYHQDPPGFTGLTDVNPTCKLEVVEGSGETAVVYSNVLDITFTVHAGGPA